MLTIEQWIEHYGPRDRAYSPIDIKTGWNAAMAEFFVHHWEFRVVFAGECDCSDWYDIPFNCVQPMLELFGDEIELRPIFHRAGNIERGKAALARITVVDGTDVPF